MNTSLSVPMLPPEGSYVQFNIPVPVWLDPHGKAVKLPTIITVEDQQVRFWWPSGFLCQLMGTDPRAQRTRILESEVFDEYRRTYRVSYPRGGTQNSLCLDAEAVPFWMGTLNTKRMRADVAKGIVARQRLLLRIVALAMGALQRGETTVNLASALAPLEHHTRAQILQFPGSPHVDERMASAHAMLIPTPGDKLPANLRLQDVAALVLQLEADIGDIQEAIFSPFVDEGE